MEDLNRILYYTLETAVEIYFVAEFTIGK